VQKIQSITNAPVAYGRHGGNQPRINLYVVRDDLLPGGTKTRGLIEYLLRSNFDSFIYAGPETGYGQVALAISVLKANSILQAMNKPVTKRAIVFVSQYQRQLSIATNKARESHAELFAYDKLPLKVLEANAQKYLHEEYKKGKNICILPFGLSDPDLMSILVLNMRHAVGNVSPARCWVVVGSGMIVTALSQVWPKTHFCLVRVGKRIDVDLLKKLEGRVTAYPLNQDELPQWFEDEVPNELLPPYPSVKTYDAKIWQYLANYGQEGDYIWNVAAD
jgi:hypothetical protein